MNRSVFYVWEAEKFYHINTWFLFSVNNFFSPPFSGVCFTLQHSWSNWMILLILLNYHSLLKWNMKICEMPSGNVLTAVHCNHAAWQAVIYILSATTQPSMCLPNELWCIYFLFLPYVPPRFIKIKIVIMIWSLTTDCRKLNSSEENRHWADDNCPFYWQDFKNIKT